MCHPRRVKRGTSLSLRGANREETRSRGLDHRAHPAVDAELAVDATEMRGHRPLADAEMTRDLARRQVLGRNLQHLLLAWGQPGLEVPPLIVAVGEEAHPVHWCAGQNDLAPGGPPDRSEGSTLLSR